jgi:hypothetical protein
MEEMFLKFKLHISYNYEEETTINEVTIDLNDINSFQDFVSLISKEIEFRINLSNQGIQIRYEELWVKVIDLKSLYFFLGCDLKLGLLTKIRIHSGSEIDPINQSLRPNMAVYDFKNQPEVLCSFCEVSSKDEDMIIKLGPFYGPFKEGTKRYFVHELCGLWAPESSLDKFGKLKNIQKEVRRAKIKKCTYCGNRGGVIGCNWDECDNSYHYLCAKSIKCHFHLSRYLIHCPLHIKYVPLVENLPIEEVEEPENVEGEFANLVCQECMSGMDEDKLLICDGCKQGIHTYCNTPEIFVIPPDNEEFYCPYCVNKRNS